MLTRTCSARRCSLALQSGGGGGGLRGRLRRLGCSTAAAATAVATTAVSSSRPAPRGGVNVCCYGGLGSTRAPLRASLYGSSSHYRPFSSEDEAALASVLANKPRHVARHIRQSMLNSRRRIAQFRNAVTYLMIALQAKLQRKEMAPEDASAIMESLMRECVDLRQGDMAHLLFRAAIRFRKYGLTIGFPFVRHLYESYKRESAKELMANMAHELKAHKDMRMLAVLAYQFSGMREESVALWETVPKETVTTQDYCAVLEGMGMTGLFKDIVSFAERVIDDVTATQHRGIDLSAVVSAAAVASRGSTAALNAVVRLAKAHKLALSDAAVGALARSRLQEKSVTSLADVHRVEASLCAELDRVSLGLAADSAIITKSSELMVRHQEGGDEAMLQKLHHLRRLIEDAIAQDSVSDVDPLFAASLIRGLGAMGRYGEMRECFDLLQKAGEVKDHKLYDEMLRWYAHGHNLKEVIALKEEMTRREVHHTTLTYQNVFRVLDRYYPRLVEKYLAEMRSKGIQVEGSMYPTLVRVFHVLRDTAKVEQLYREAKLKTDKGLPHNMSAALVTQMLHCYPKDIARGEALVQDAERYGLLTNEAVQAAVVNLYACNDRTDALHAFLARLPHRTANVYRILLRTATQQHNRAQFNAVLGEMEARQVPLNERLFSVIVSSLSHFHDAEGVRAYVHKAMTSSQIHTPLFFADAAAALARIGDVDAVDQCWSDLLETKMTVTMPVYNRFLDVYMTLHNMAKVQEILDTMMRLVPPNPITATTVVDMLGKMGRLSEMEAILAEMAKSTNAAPTLVTFHQAMNAYAKCGDVAKMEALRERLQREGFQENAVTYNILFEGYGRAKRFEHLLELVAERKSRGIPMEEFGFVVLLNTYARARMPAEAEALIEEMLGSSSIVITSRLLATMAATFSYIGHTEKMQHYVTLLLAHPECRVRDVESVYLMYARLRDTVRLQELLDSPKLPKSALIYNTAVSAFARAGEHAKVAHLLTEMEKRGFVLSRNTSVVLSSLLLKAGKLELAQTVLKWKGLTPADVEGSPAEAAAGAVVAGTTATAAATSSEHAPAGEESEFDAEEADLLLRDAEDDEVVVADRMHEENGVVDLRP
ncbi:PPR repeat/Pentatricopeptide repeat domain containing protein [Novymonas esmeraldas]|uniref:PPR repeat/Pentatricopeptide repeat domain containing protein n=1 Tax=Novymonas esmeraldas TaxID=1808958 RepID=A0AAW0F434_9TRYP